MTASVETARATALEPVGPSERVEALAGLVLAPFAILYGILAGVIRLVRRARPLESGRAIETTAGDRLVDVAAFAADAESASCAERRGFGAVDFELSYARDFVPSSLDAYPRWANRFFRCPPPFRRVTFESLDGTPLAAEMAVHDDGVARPGLVVVHGTFGSSSQEIYATPAVTAFRDWGFNAIVVDLRGWGRSSALSNAPLSGGWREAEDVLGAAKYLLDNSSTTTVGAMGFSLGGAAVLLAAAHDRAPELVASGVFSESGFVDARAVVGIVDGMPSPLARAFIPHWIFRLGLAKKFAALGHSRIGVVEYFERVAAPYYGVPVEALYRGASAVYAVDRMRVPVFALHAVDDWIVPVRHAVRLREAAERAGNRRVGVCIRRRGAHCAFRRVSGAWRERVAHEFFARTSGIALENDDGRPASTAKRSAAGATSPVH